MFSITPIRAFSDNYIWVLHQHGYAIAVDPGDDKPLMDFLNHHQLALSMVWVTHHHHDHTGGLTALATYWPHLTIYGPPTVSQVTHPVKEGAVIPFLDNNASVLSVPGHTLDHLAYWVPGHLFCGDTLFGAGCGRVFEGITANLYQSLRRLAQLPGDTFIYPAHEYTLKNLLFAQEVDPSNPAITTRYIEAQAKQERGQPTLPSTLTQERATNPFLRTQEPELIAAASRHANHRLTTGEQVFSELRRWKNTF